MRQLTNKLSLQPYPFAVVMGDDDVFMFRWHTIHGLMRINETDKLIDLFAIANDQMHNGKFVEFIEMMESHQRNGDMQYGVSEFFNPRLRDWFKRRGYIHFKMSDTMFYQSVPAKVLTETQRV